MKVTNKSAYFDYELGDRIEAGMVLSGAEAKSAKGGNVDMGNSYVRIRAKNGAEKGALEAWIVGLHIYPYKQADNTNYDPQRTRKLLLNKKEILALEMKMKSAGRTLVPVSMYDKHGRVKVELALARGKKVYEKREAIKKRDLDREER